MSFQEAGSNSDQNSKESSGLPKYWENLTENCCPICSDTLSLFEHVNLWKCGCGFKISRSKRDEIVGDIQYGRFIPSNNGYRYGKYHDEPPF